MGSSQLAMYRYKFQKFLARKKPSADKVSLLIYAFLGNDGADPRVAGAYKPNAVIKLSVGNQAQALTADERFSPAGQRQSPPCKRRRPRRSAFQRFGTELTIHASLAPKPVPVQ